MCSSTLFRMLTTTVVYAFWRERQVACDLSLRLTRGLRRKPHEDGGVRGCRFATLCAFIRSYAGVAKQDWRVMYFRRKPSCLGPRPVQEGVRKSRKYKQVRVVRTRRYLPSKIPW